MSHLLFGGLSKCLKKSRTIASIKMWQMRCLKRSYKFDIELPKTVEQACALDSKNDNTLWADAIFKEMENVREAFKVIPDGKSVPIGNQFVPCHMVFNIKIEGFRQKTRLVAGGHMIQAPATIIFASVV